MITWNAMALVLWNQRKMLHAPKTTQVPQRDHAVNLLQLFGISASIMITVATALSLITTANKFQFIRSNLNQ
jgi:hypothetical protein